MDEANDANKSKSLIDKGPIQTDSKYGGQQTSTLSAFETEYIPKPEVYTISSRFGKIIIFVGVISFLSLILSIIAIVLSVNTKNAGNGSLELDDIESQMQALEVGVKLSNSSNTKTMNSMKNINERLAVLMHNISELKMDFETETIQYIHSSQLNATEIKWNTFYDHLTENISVLFYHLSVLESKQFNHSQQLKQINDILLNASVRLNYVYGAVDNLSQRIYSLKLNHSERINTVKQQIDRLNKNASELSYLSDINKNNITNMRMTQIDQTNQLQEMDNKLLFIQNHFDQNISALSYGLNDIYEEIENIKLNHTNYLQTMDNKLSNISERFEAVHIALAQNVNNISKDIDDKIINIEGIQYNHSNKLNDLNAAINYTNTMMLNQNISSLTTRFLHVNDKINDFYLVLNQNISILSNKMDGDFFDVTERLTNIEVLQTNYSNIALSSQYSGWPDSIVCHASANPAGLLFYYLTKTFDAAQVISYYNDIYGYQLQFYFNGDLGADNGNTDCNGKNISTLVAAGKTFSFVASIK
eukprot:46974_1